jgi:hypothetical protein
MTKETKEISDACLKSQNEMRIPIKPRTLKVKLHVASKAGIELPAAKKLGKKLSL